MADKSRFGLELTKAEIDAFLVDNTTPGNIMEFLTKQLFYLGLLDIKYYNQLGDTRLVGYLSLHIQCALVE